jgi:hypothetical protein
MAGFDLLQTLALPDIMRPWSDGGAVMALDEKLRRQLIEAREHLRPARATRGRSRGSL